ncbi:MAG: 2-dehydro-3-deoxygalactonokinase [Saprospiraceae bacterium]|nr:2-dehydro-3-deoxygalactonokinase [Saprospiraceae bacterium]
MGQHFISIDWGTTQFRMFLVNANNTRIILRHSSADGIKSVHQARKETNDDQEHFFLRHLASQINLWTADLEGDEPILISGMASSTIGMRSLPYAKLPFSCNGEGLYIERINQSQISHPLFLLSGVRAESDVMRGEETQLIGITKDLDLTELTVVLPGTHSKHIFINEGMVVQFKTYMTGEVFEVLSKHTILNESLLKGDLNDHVIPSFLDGVVQSLQKGFLNELFKLRAKDLFGQKSKTENYFFLSGILIGQELNNLLAGRQKEIKIGATGDLASLYLLAARQLNLSASIVTEDVMNQAVVTGHQKLIRKIIDY